MKLTPLDIRHKEFKRGMRGYADVEVDEFLDQVADEYERLFKENIDLEERVAALEEKIAGYRRIEDTLQKTLINAQANAEEQKQNAARQAELVVQDAELKARQLVDEAHSERRGIEQSVARLRSMEEDFRFKFRTILEAYLRQISEESQDEGKPGASEFSRHAEAIKEAIARESVAKKARPEETAGGAQTETHASRGRGELEAEAQPPVDDPEVTASTPLPSGERGPAREGRRDDIVFGETDDLLADVDTGVNEDEFTW